MSSNVRLRALCSVYFKLFVLLIFVFMCWVALKYIKASEYLAILVLLTIIIITFDKLLRPASKWPEIIRYGGGNIKRLREAINNTDNINIADGTYGRTALHEAVCSCRVENVILLINSGADINIRDKENRTPLMEAVYFCYEEVVRTLINAGADANARSNAGLTALDFAEPGASKEIIALLKHAGAINGGPVSPI
jgi:Ankyrin repeats (many copies)